MAVAVDCAWFSHALMVHHDHDFNTRFGLGLVAAGYVALFAGSAGPTACRNIAVGGSAALSLVKCAVFLSCVAAEPFLGLGLVQWSSVLLVAIAVGQWPHQWPEQRWPDQWPSPWQTLKGIIRES